MLFMLELHSVSNISSIIIYCMISRRTKVLIRFNDANHFIDTGIYALKAKLSQNIPFDGLCTVGFIN